VSILQRFTSKDLDLLPDLEGVRYEIIAGELYVSHAPHWGHQYACGEVFLALQSWSHQTGLGVASSAPGLVFTEDDDVIPDVVWMSRARRATALDASGHLGVAPELVVEVLSPGLVNELRDREAKLQLYSRQGTEEYWIVDWRAKRVDVHRRVGEALRLVASLTSGDILTSPLLPDFACPVSSLWEPAI
jgi:Uma2 family endonuclease